MLGSGVPIIAAPSYCVFMDDKYINISKAFSSSLVEKVGASTTFNSFVPIKEVAQAKGLNSTRSIRMEINKPESKYISREVKVNGGSSYEVLFSSLKPELQQKLREKETKSTALVPLNYQPPTVVTDKARLMAQHRINIVKAALEHRKKYRTNNEADFEFLDLFNTGLYLPKANDFLGSVSIGTLRRWIQAYKRYETITSKDISSNQYILIGQTQSGEILTEEQCRKLLSLPVIECEERHHIDQIRYGKLLQDFAGAGSLDNKISKEQIIQKYIEDKKGSFAYEVEKIKLLAGRKKTQLETDLNDIKTEIKDLKKQTGASKLEELKITKQIKVLEKDLLQREEKLFYAKVQVDVETEQEIADLTNKYNFNVLMNQHFKVQIFNTRNPKAEEPIQEEIILENPNMRYCIKPKINTLP